MIENRRFYRLPSHTRFVLGNVKNVFTGKSTNLSFGGSFIHLLTLGDIQNGDKLKCEFMLQESGPVLSCNCLVKRVALGSSNPADFSGVGIEFFEFFGDSQKILDEYLLDQKRIYELMGTLLMNTEPDLRSMKMLIAKLPISRQSDLRDLRVFIESTLRAIHMVEKKSQPPVSP